MATKAKYYAEAREQLRWLRPYLHRGGDEARWCLDAALKALASAEAAEVYAVEVGWVAVSASYAEIAKRLEQIGEDAGSHHETATTSVILAAASTRL